MANSYKQSNKADDNPYDPNEPDRMLVYNAGEKYCAGLSHCHDHGECNCAKLVDGFVYEQLSDGRRDGESGDVADEGWVARREGERLTEAALLGEGRARQQYGEEVCAGHHLDG